MKFKNGMKFILIKIYSKILNQITKIIQCIKEPKFTFHNFFHFNIKIKYNFLCLNTVNYITSSYLKNEIISIYLTSPAYRPDRSPYQGVPTRLLLS